MIGSGASRIGEKKDGVRFTELWIKSKKLSGEGLLEKKGTQKGIETFRRPIGRGLRVSEGLLTCLLDAQERPAV